MKKNLLYIHSLLCVLAILTLNTHAEPNASEPVDLVLALAVDVSNSIDAEDYQLQTKGIMEALSDPNVFDIINQCRPSGIAMTYIEWSSESITRVKMTTIRTQEQLAAFGQLVGGLQRASWLPMLENGTYIGQAIRYATREILRARLGAKHMVIDISGDGEDNGGIHAPEQARDKAKANGISINGLVILDDPGYKERNPDQPLDQYYKDHVIGGDGSFVRSTPTHNEYAEAIKANIIRDVCPLMM